MPGDLVKSLHNADYAWVLPAMARLPLKFGYMASSLRGLINGRIGRDWRSMALGTRHVARQAAAGYRLLRPQATEAELQSFVRERFYTESREEFEGRLIVAGRVAELSRIMSPDIFLEACLHRERGLLLLTPHFDSFMLGIAFLGQAGMTINVMTSAVTNDPLVSPAVQQHFFKKYRGMERLMNGGRMLDMELGLRPFYQMLERGECLVVLADAPAVAGGVTCTPDFLGGHRLMAGGALRMALKTDSDISAFVCRCEKPGCYLLKGAPVIAARHPEALDTAYRFLAEEIEATPGKWWASDLLPLMPPVDGQSQEGAAPLMTGKGSRFWMSAAPVFGLGLLVVLILYGGSLQSWWCCDDPQILKHALTYSPWEYFSKPEVWRALIPYSLTPWLSLAYDFDHTIFGLQPAGYYAHNLVMIVFCACLIYQIARQWVDNWHAAGGALLFLVGSPVMAASQQLMVRHYVEGLFYYLLTLWLIMRELKQGTDRPGWLAGLAFAIAATAKELYLPLGFVLFLLPMGSFRQRLQVAWPIVLIMLLYVPWRWYMLGDVVGGYTPAGELGRSDLIAAFSQFANIPGLLLAIPWFGLSAIGLAMVFLLLRDRKNRWVLLLLVALPVLLLAPLIPLARMPGIGAGSERYFIALWAVVSVGVAVILGRIAVRCTASIRLVTLTALLLLVVSAWMNTRQALARLLPTLHEQQVQGKALVTASSRAVIYLTPEVAAWYVTGIMDLRNAFGQTGPPPQLVADERDLDRLSLPDRQIIRYDRTRKAMVDITPQVSAILIDWRKKVRPAPLAVTMVFNTGTKTLQWQLGPYQAGSYTLLPEGGRQPVPALGALRMDKPPDKIFRFRYDAPEGWIAYTPPLHFVPGGAENYRISWHGTGLPVENR